MRRLLLPCLVLACAALRAAVVPVPTSVVPERIPGAKPKNVILILTDDHRSDAMSFMGHPIAETPHLDALARNGVHFKNALVTTSLCSPSRASILTGLYTFRHRVIDNNRPIPPGTLYFPQYLQRAGYATSFFGKWHMGGEDDQPQPGSTVGSASAARASISRRIPTTRSTSTVAAKNKKATSPTNSPTTLSSG